MLPEGERSKLTSGNLITEAEEGILRRRVAPPAGRVRWEIKRRGESKRWEAERRLLSCGAVSCSRVGLSKVVRLHADLERHGMHKHNESEGSKERDEDHVTSLNLYERKEGGRKEEVGSWEGLWVSNLQAARLSCLQRPSGGTYRARTQKKEEGDCGRQRLVMSIRTPGSLKDANRVWAHVVEERRTASPRKGPRS